MTQHKYAYQKSEENIAKAVGRNLSVSPKQGTEICKYVRGRSITQAKMLLQQAIDGKRAVPFTRFTNGVGHKHGMSAGRYHPKACSQILAVINSAEANAKNKGYNSSDLKIVHIAMQIGPRNAHHGRKRRSIFKNSHIEVVVQEIKGSGKTDKKILKKPLKTITTEKKTVKKQPEEKVAETKVVETVSNANVHKTKEHVHQEHAGHAKKDD
jgi:large subunit ribosomal protein L22